MPPQLPTAPGYMGSFTGSPASLWLPNLTGRALREMAVPTRRQLDVHSLPAGSYPLLLSEPEHLLGTRRVALE